MKDMNRRKYTHHFMQTSRLYAVKTKHGDVRRNLNTMQTPSILVLPHRVKGALYGIWCGLNKLGDSGVNVVSIDSAIIQLLLSRRVRYC